MCIESFDSEHDLQFHWQQSHGLAQVWADGEPAWVRIGQHANTRTYRPTGIWIPPITEDSYPRPVTMGVPPVPLTLVTPGNGQGLTRDRLSLPCEALGTPREIQCVPFNQTVMIGNRLPCEPQGLVRIPATPLERPQRHARRLNQPNVPVHPHNQPSLPDGAQNPTDGAPPQNSALPLAAVQQPQNLPVSKPWRSWEC